MWGVGSTMDTQCLPELLPACAVPARCLSSPEDVSVPSGAPKWVTPALITKTLQVWQPYYDYPLTTNDALDMLLNVGLLFDTLGHGGEP